MSLSGCLIGQRKRHPSQPFILFPAFPEGNAVPFDLIGKRQRFPFSAGFRQHFLFPYLKDQVFSAFRQIAVVGSDIRLFLHKLPEPVCTVRQGIRCSFCFPFAVRNEIQYGLSFVYRLSFRPDHGKRGLIDHGKPDSGKGSTSERIRFSGFPVCFLQAYASADHVVGYGQRCQIQHLAVILFLTADRNNPFQNAGMQISLRRRFLPDLIGACFQISRSG